jgi:hypothetical protein
MKKSRPALKDLSENLPKSQRQFIENGKAVAAVDSPPEKGVGLFLRVPPALAARLRRACLKRELDGKAPWQLKDIAAQAFEQWLAKEGE